MFCLRCWLLSDLLILISNLKPFPSIFFPLFSLRKGEWENGCIQEKRCSLPCFYSSGCHPHIVTRALAARVVCTLVFAIISLIVLKSGYRTILTHPYTLCLHIPLFFQDRSWRRFEFEQLTWALSECFLSTICNFSKSIQVYALKSDLFWCYSNYYLLSL